MVRYVTSEVTPIVCPDPLIVRVLPWIVPFWNRRVTNGVSPSKRIVARWIAPVRPLMA